MGSVASIAPHAQSVRVDGQDILQAAVQYAIELELSRRSQWLTVAQVVERTGVTHCTVRSWIHEGRLKATHWGRSRQWHVRAGDLEAFLKGEH